ncbi:uncharacterized protein GGS25DRAFT_358866 [Hypoxylon fragiforme]|uniref:uncharacterized protein n=1 Tax=Hypoxylon fragiforme TaxID=63214 RepID=UPI0020C6C162|nr:uncharacterized protein GGS25DRAFT_358866 [Hypoxylon fragiforme]KAI2605845.1 hypothetical protein GGS25DRAFT_358866 [Hypoxylon fragiforme]
MSNQEGIAFCPFRSDPIGNVQVADFSNIQYLQPEGPDEEVAYSAGDIAPKLNDVNEDQSQQRIYLKPPLPKSPPPVKPHKVKTEKPDKPDKPAPAAPKPVKDSSTELTGRARKKAKKREKDKEKKKVKSKTDDAVRGMEESTAKQPEPEQPPEAHVAPEEPSLKAEAEATESKDVPTSTHPADQKPVVTETNKETKSDTESKPKSDSPNKDDEIKEASQNSISSDAAPTHDSSDPPVPEQPNEPAASEPTQKTVDAPATTETLDDIKAASSDKQVESEITPEPVKDADSAAANDTASAESATETCSKVLSGKEAQEGASQLTEEATTSLPKELENIHDDIQPGALEAPGKVEESMLLTTHYKVPPRGESESPKPKDPNAPVDEQPDVNTGDQSSVEAPVFSEGVSGTAVESQGPVAAEDTKPTEPVLDSATSNEEGDTNETTASEVEPQSETAPKTVDKPVAEADLEKSSENKEPCRK